MQKLKYKNEEEDFDYFDIHRGIDGFADDDEENEDLENNESDCDQLVF